MFISLSSLEVTVRTESSNNRFGYDSASDSHELHLLGHCKVQTYSGNSANVVSFSISTLNGDGRVGGRNIITCSLQDWTLDLQLGLSSYFSYLIGTTKSLFQMFTFPEIKFPAWWGTEVIKNTADVLGTPLRTLEQG